MEFNLNPDDQKDLEIARPGTRKNFKERQRQLSKFRAKEWEDRRSAATKGMTPAQRKDWVAGRAVQALKNWN
jgi:hypothetical protein